MPGTRTYKHPIFLIDVALAVGIPITTNVMTMITPHRATGTGPVNGMMIGTLRDATAIAARAIIMMVGDVIALIAGLEAQEDVRGIGELGKLAKHHITGPSFTNKLIQITFTSVDRRRA